MHTSLFVTSLLSGLLVGCQAYPSEATHIDKHKFILGGPNDSRSPCPALNALANQAYLPRDGRNIDKEQLRQALLDIYNMQLSPAFDGEVDSSLKNSHTGNSSTFNLEDTMVHNDIEVDGSLSRKDLYFGDNIHFDADIWAQSSSVFGPHVITIETAAYSRRLRTANAMKENPEFVLNDFIAGLAPAIYMLVFSPQHANATWVPRAWIESFFRDRLPTHLGWKKSDKLLTGDDIFALAAKVSAVPPQPTATSVPSAQEAITWEDIIRHVWGHVSRN